MTRTRDEKRAQYIKVEKYQHMIDLDDEFPKANIFGEQCIGADCGPGWTEILRPALAAIVAAGGIVEQIKQKWGELCIYWTVPGLSHSDRLRSFSWMAADAVVARAEHLSLATCETCGTSIDPPRERSGKTVCDSCRYQGRW